MGYSFISNLQLLERASHQFAAKIPTSFPIWECQFGFAL
jgi:hypothetical protein